VADRSERAPASPEGRPDFYLNVVRGIEEVAASELFRLGARVVATRPSKVFFDYPGDPRPLLSLRSAMQVYAFIGEHLGCPPDSAAQSWLQHIARGLDLRPALNWHAALHAPVQQPSFRITAARSGRHEYTSPEIAAWVGSAIQAETSWTVDLERCHYDIEVELVDARALFGLRLGERWKDRRKKPVYHPTSLNPTVAYAMISLLGCGPTEVFLDPACGGGTLLTERAAFGPARLLLGGDIWARALGYAAQTLAAANVQASLLRWDAGHLAIRPASVDRVAANLPFGYRTGRGPTVRSFYRRLLPELVRVLRPGGRAALLTSRRRWLSLAISDSPQLQRDRSLRILLGGKEAFIFLLSRAV